MERVEEPGQEGDPRLEQSPADENHQQCCRRVEERLTYIDRTRRPAARHPVVGGDVERIARSAPALRPPERVARSVGRETASHQHVLGDLLVGGRILAGHEIGAGGDHRQPDHEADCKNGPEPGRRDAVAAGPLRVLKDPTRAALHPPT